MAARKNAVASRRRSWRMHERKHLLLQQAIGRYIGLAIAIPVPLLPKLIFVIAPEDHWNYI
jgi:hypothetical protein